MSNNTAPSFDPVDCDPSWSLCEDWASPGANSTSSSNPSNSTASNSTNETGTPTANALLWNTLSTLMFTDGYLTYKAYDDYAISLSSANIATKSTWTKSYIQQTTPIFNWYVASGAIMGLQGLSMFGWTLKLLIGADSLFYQITRIAKFFPVIEMGFLGYTYYKYEDCSALLSTNFDGGLPEAQKVSCKSGTDALYGSSGTIVKEVSVDPWETWMLAGWAASSALFLISWSSRDQFKEAYGSNGTTGVTSDGQSAGESAAGWIYGEVTGDECTNEYCDGKVEVKEDEEGETQTSSSQNNQPTDWNNDQAYEDSVKDNGSSWDTSGNDKWVDKDDSQWEATANSLL